jgi:hypothetical protein
MSRADEVYHYSRSLDRELSKLKTGVLGEENSRIILEFYSQLVAEGVSAARRLKYLITLRAISTLIGKPFSEVTKEDVVRFVGTIEQRSYSEWTKRDFRVCMQETIPKLMLNSYRNYIDPIAERSYNTALIVEK